VYHRLSQEQLVEIVDIQSDEVIKRALEKGLHLLLSAEAKEFIVREGSDEQYGARPLRRAVQQYIEDPLAEYLLRGDFAPGTTVQVRPAEAGDVLVFEPLVPAEGVIA